MKPDIRERIARDFGPDQEAAMVRVETFEAEAKLSPRVSRCIVHLAKGDLSKLETYIENAKYDWRDVIYWAEAVPLEYNRPFKDSSFRHWPPTTFFAKVRITPILLLSTLSVLIALFTFISNQHDEEGWGEFAAIILLVGGLIGVGVYLFLRFALRLRYLYQVLVELALLGLFFLIIKMH
ncbi:MAG TPA: hypothetical protein VMH27_09035 [Puia sp.]|nr:hypothetical protein [Puia sp.]